MAKNIEYKQPDLKDEDLRNDNTPERIQSVLVSNGVFDFIGDWILKDFLEHEGG